MQKQSIQYAEEGAPSVLGEQLPNPYMPDNMQQAQSELENQGIVSEKTFQVRATHYYVKFTPTSEAQLRELYSDTTLNLYDIPLDYELAVVGNWYRAPGLSDSVPTPHYASVRTDFQFNSKISYEILSELYIPEEDETLIGSNYDENLSYMVELLNEAYALTGGSGVPFMPVAPPEEGGGGNTYHPPTGTILTFDTRLGRNIGLEGAKVTAKRWFTTHRGYTNENGEYNLDGYFLNPATFTIHFQRPGFIVADYTTFIGTWLKYSKVVRKDISGNHWSHTIELGYENMQSHVFRAAYRYYYKDIDGLMRPNYPFSQQVIAAKNSKKDWSGINYIGLPILKIARFSSNNQEYGSDEYFSTTIHEIAHTSHAKKAGIINYIQLSDLIRESWPIAVEWYLTSMEYKGLGIANYGDWNYNPPNPPQFPNYFGYQYWNSNFDAIYTSLFINLIDDFNEMAITFPPLIPGQVNDQVFGYSISYLESNILPYVYTLNGLSPALKSQKPSGVSDNQIDILFSSY